MSSFSLSFVSIPLYLILLFQLTGSLAQNSSLKNNVIKTLRQHLLSEYDTLARPVQDASKTTVVTVDLSPFHLTEVIEYEGVICLEAWIDMYWHDEHLQWNPRNFQGLKVVHFSQEEIWKPDIFIFERRDSYSNQFNEKVQLEVDYKGKVSWLPGSTLYLICELNYEHFPSDVQECRIYIMAWGHDSVEVDLKVKYENVTKNFFYSSNPVWTLETISGRAFHPNTSASDFTAIARYVLKLRRKASIDRLITDTPYVAAKVLLLVSYWVPVHSRNRFILGGATLLIQISVLFFTEYMLPSPSAGAAALPHLRTAILTGVIGVLLHVVVTNVSRIRKWTAPSILNVLTSGAVGNVFCLCTVDFPHNAQQAERSLPKLQSPKEREWYVVATLLDRLIFFIILLVFIIEYALS